ncbi:hypothetical protein CWE08_03090 [Aliidiomarina iranensis]|uniref:Uncharacterized protein n=1 Tax=Aliidiomarina iranensis TaxID=1434071 RepID=A0A432W348_9GAMM|nr:hypothetical protein [Aliidiomarina iranensis]RUO23647.1 hypothetical protein CWE08_03090 [Aliidiomarina iranensis]
MKLKSRFIKNERRRQLWKRHSRNIVDRRNKWFYLTETKLRPPVCPHTPDPEYLDFQALKD